MAQSNDTTPGKAIVWRRDTHDYDLYMNGEYVGSASTYTEGETRLNALAFERFGRAGSVWSGRVPALAPGSGRGTAQ